MVSVDEETTPEEMCGWYMYDFANSPYFQVYVVGVFPVLAKWLAEAYAARGADWTDAEIFSCSTGQGAEDPAHLKIPGLGITAGSFPVAVGWVTIVVQMFCLLSFASLGDYGPYRKQLLKTLTFAGSIVITFNIFGFSPDVYWLVGSLRVIAGACFVLCVNYYNAYLPLLMEADPSAKHSLDERMRLTDEASSRGNLAGYAGGVLLLIVSFVLHKFMECDPCKTMGTCKPFHIFIAPALCCSMVGLWWGSISIYSFWRLKERPGEDFPDDGSSIFLMGWKDTASTFRLVLDYRQTFVFLLVYFISSDSLSTLIGNAMLIMEEEATATTGKWMTLTSMHINWILGAIAAFVGIFMYNGIQKLLGISNKHLIMFQFVLMMGVATACLSGGIRTIGFIPVMAPVSLTIGSMQSLVRSVYVNLIPPGKEASMFAFYEITDKGSNLIGAAVTVFVHNACHSYLPTMWYILLGFGASTVVLYFVDVEQGMKDIGKTEQDNPLVDGSE